MLLSINHQIMSAEEENADSQCKLGAYYTGINTQLPAEWYDKAAQQWNGEAQVNLGLAYLHGDGVPKDVSKAVALIRKSAEQHHVGGLMMLAIMLTEGEHVPLNIDEAIQCLHQAIQYGENNTEHKDVMGKAHCFLGGFYSEGIGVPQDETKAFTLFRKAAELGDAEGQYYLALCYVRGTGVQQNHTNLDGFQPNQTVVSAYHNKNLPS
jgi:TPR repeat protein